MFATKYINTKYRIFDDEYFVKMPKKSIFFDLPN